jgi:chemotaxis protein MotB
MAEAAEEDTEELESTPPAEPSEEESEEEGCPACKSGAPAWMATFADMATLLMAFFVLLLSFSDTEVPKFEQINGSVKAAFGIRKVIPTISIPAARSLVVETFTPAIAQRTVLDQQTQRSDDIASANLVVRDGPASDDFELEQELRRVESALEDAIAAGDAAVRVEDGEIVVEVTARSAVSGTNSNPADGSAGVVSQTLVELATDIVEAQSTVTRELQVYVTTAPGADTPGTQAANDSAEESPDQRLQEVRSDLNTQIEQGLVEVEMIDRGILIRLNSQDSFLSGSAELQAGFLAVLREVGDTLAQDQGTVLVEGHTDSVPVVFSDRFNSNWDLSALRAASVADYLSQESQIDSKRLRVIGLADTVPLEPNTSANGRARNRRIEIIMVNGG